MNYTIVSDAGRPLDIFYTIDHVLLLAQFKTLFQDHGATLLR